MSDNHSDRLKVLAVDDETDLLTVYEGYLRPECSVTTANSGVEALEMIDESFDVILLDRRMPGMSGSEVLDAIRERGINTPIAMLTAVKPDLDIVEMPFDEYLEKPVDRQMLKDTVRVLANRARFEQESRQFFRLASKKASLAERQLDREDREEYRQLLQQFADLESTLDDTLQQLLHRNVGIVAETTPTDDEVVELLSEIHDHSLPEPIHELVTDYQSLEGSRPLFMWKWVHLLAPQNALPCVPQRHREKVAVDKTLLILYITLLDDRLERHGDRATFEAISSLPSGEVRASNQADDAYLAFGQRLWETISSRIAQAPNFDTYEELFHFDLEQAFDAIEYSELIIANPELATLGDLERYESHNMVMFAYADIDLMHADHAHRDDLATIRDAIWTAQHMARIGNWVSTWERELREGDLSAGPIVYAKEHDIVDVAELAACRSDADTADRVIARIHDHDIEKRFLGKWERLYHQLREYNDQIESVDLEEFVRGTEEILRYHLASRGLK